jgi:hypothetical protein
MGSARNKMMCLSAQMLEMSESMYSDSKYSVVQGSIVKEKSFQYSF